MKIANKLLLSSFLLLGCLAGCTTNKTSSESSEYQYTTSDIKYFTKAKELICTLNIGSTKRKYFKAFDGYCAVALANIGDYCGPVLVGEDQGQVCFTTDAVAGVTYQCAGSVEVNDKTYYYSRADSFLSGSLDESIKYDIYCSKYTSLEQVAKDVAEQATFVAVDASSKKEYLYIEETDGTLTIKAGPSFAGKKQVEIPSEINGKSVGAIAKNGFNGFIDLEELKLPNTLTKIDELAFWGCSKLKKVFIPSSVQEISYAVFEKCSTNIHIFCGVSAEPAGYQNYDATYGDAWNQGAKGTHFGSQGWLDYENCLYSVDSTLRDPNAMNLTLVSYKLDSNGALQLPESGYLYLNEKNYYVNNIGDSFKEDKQIRSINIPYSVKIIPNNAFAYCDNLFFTMNLNQTDLEYIGDYAFRNTKLSEMRLPKTMKYIGEGAFSGTTFNTINFDGTTDEWNSIGKSGSLIDFIINTNWRKGSAIAHVSCIGGTIDF